MHIEGVAYLFVLFTLLTKPFTTFLVLSQYDGTTARSSIFPAPTVSIFVSILFFLWLSKHVKLLKCQLHSAHGESNSHGYTRWARHTVTKSLFTCVYGITPAFIPVCVKHVTFSCSTSQVICHVIMTCHIVIKYFESFE